MDMVLSHPLKSWNWYCLSKNPGITTTDILQNLDQPWKWSVVADNPSIDIVEIIAKSGAPLSSFEWVGVSRHASVTMKRVLEHLDWPWWWGWLSSNCNFGVKEALAHPNQPWEWWQLSRNPNVTFQDILDHPDKPWKWYYVSLNPNVTMENILAYPDKDWAWNLLSMNRYGFNYERAKRRQVARTLQFKEELVEKTWHPDRFLDWCMDVDA
jgi:hypothetical protein